jgi:hypothetical protein
MLVARKREVELCTGGIALRDLPVPFQGWLGAIPIVILALSTSTQPQAVALW